MCNVNSSKGVVLWRIYRYLGGATSTEQVKKHLPAGVKLFKGR